MDNRTYFALVIAGLFGVLQLTNARSFQVFGDLVARVDTDRAVVALTFDDGPTTDYTQPVLEPDTRSEIYSLFVEPDGPYYFAGEHISN